jgi:hypothetical protein
VLAIAASDREARVCLAFGLLALSPDQAKNIRPNGSYTVNRFVRVSAKFGTCTVVSVDGTLVENIMR